MSKKNKHIIPHNPYCLNCEHALNGHELFCPNCGQKNKNNHITLSVFIKEVFAGLFSWDSKFWRTCFTLILKPGSISLDYISGKRQRYANPFRFYITASILFFLIHGISETLNNLHGLQESAIVLNTPTNTNNSEAHNELIAGDLKHTKHSLDSIKHKFKKEIKTKDTTIVGNQPIVSGKIIQLDHFMEFSKKHPKMNTSSALDSLRHENNLWNRFIYTRAKLANSFFSEENTRKQLASKMLSYGSISLFILLPIFTLFLKLIYIRRDQTYIEHLIFVFHIQTVFFLLLTILTLINIFTIIPTTAIFLILFLVYLYLAMKRFYQQGVFKTFFKFIILNIIYLTLAFIGITLVGLLSFALF